MLESRAKAAEDAKLGVRYASANFTVGTTVSPLQCEPLYMLYIMNMAAWLVSSDIKNSQSVKRCM